MCSLMGPTGAGKSHVCTRLLSLSVVLKIWQFIQKATNPDGQNSGVGHGLESCTSEVTALRISLQGGNNVVLVDTPGFGDTYLSELQILQGIEKWLKDT